MASTGPGLDAVGLRRALLAVAALGVALTATLASSEHTDARARDHTNQTIAERLVITRRSVEKYVSAIFAKLGLPENGDRRVLAVLEYLRAGSRTPASR